VIDLLLKAGSPVDAVSTDGRTALYLAAEFSRTVGQQVVDAFRKNGFIVDWNGSQSMRPTVYLQNIGDGRIRKEGCTAKPKEVRKISHR